MSNNSKNINNNYGYQPTKTIKSDTIRSVQDGYQPTKGVKTQPPNRGSSVKKS